MLQVRDIVLADYPFSDLSLSKVRPAVVLARCETRGDFVLAFLTTSSAARFPRFGIEILPSHSEWRLTGLRAPSVLRLDKLMTLNLQVIGGRIGRLPQEIHMSALRNIKLLFGIS